MAEDQVAVQKGLKKHKKKNSLKSEVAEEATEAAAPVLHSSLEKPAAAKEKKKKKNGVKHVEGDDTKKVKKRKRESLAAVEPKAAAVTTAVVLEDSAPEATTPSLKDAKKKKKKKQQLSEQQESGESDPAQEDATVREQQPSEPPKKKKKKSKQVLEDKENGISHVQLSPTAANGTVAMQAPNSAPGALESFAVPADSIAKKEKKKKKKKSKGGNATVCAAEADVEEPEADTAILVNEEQVTPAEVVAEADPCDAQEDGGGEWPEEEEEQIPVNRSFRRVKSEEWLGKKGSMKNSYEATFGSSGWGAKAQQMLGSTRGKGFRHEKTKKKRGSYMGGKIDSSARTSFKYDSD